MADPIVFELSDGRRMPQLLAELRRLHRTDAEWGVGDRGTSWLKMVDPPAQLLFHTEVDPTIRAHRGWKNREFIQFHHVTKRLRVNAATSGVDDAAPERVRVTPRLVADRESGSAELWIVGNEAILANWLAHADDRLVDRLEVARLRTNGTTKIVLQSRRGRGGPPVLALDAEAYRPYLKLSTLFIPVGKKLSPPLRRDVAMRAYSPDANHIVWLDEHGNRTAIPIVAFAPLSECIRYESPMPRAGTSMPVVPVFGLETYEVKERPAGPRIDLAAGPIQSERLAMIWDRDQWRILPTRSKS